MKGSLRPPPHRRSEGRGRIHPAKSGVLCFGALEFFPDFELNFCGVFQHPIIDGFLFKEKGGVNFLRPETKKNPTPPKERFFWGAETCGAGLTTPLPHLPSAAGGDGVAGGDRAAGGQAVDVGGRGHAGAGGGVGERMQIRVSVWTLVALRG